MKKEILCLDCGCYFNVSIGQIKKLKSKGYKVPAHCPSCRSFRWKEERRTIRRANKFERKLENE